MYKRQYTAIVAGFLIAFLGGSRVQISGPTAAFATIVAGIVATDGVDGLVAATIIAGVLLMLMGFFKLGSLIRFVPYTCLLYTSLLPNLPAPLAAIIDKLLSKMAKDRYASCEGLLHDLERCAAGEPFALGERDFGRRFEFAHELYGREGEVAQLAHDYDEAAAGGKVIAAVSGLSLIHI